MYVYFAYAHSGTSFLKTFCCKIHTINAYLCLACSLTCVKRHPWMNRKQISFVQSCFFICLPKAYHLVKSRDIFQSFSYFIFYIWDKFAIGTLTRQDEGIWVFEGLTANCADCLRLRVLKFGVTMQVRHGLVSKTTKLTYVCFVIDICMLCDLKCLVNWYLVSNSFSHRSHLGQDNTFLCLTSDLFSNLRRVWGKQTKITK